MSDKNEKVSGYIYGVVMFLIVFSFFAYLFYLGYLLIIKAASNEFADNTIVQALLAFVFSVLIGTVLTKNLEARNAQKIEAYKVKKDIALTIINLAGVILTTDEIENKRAIELLTNENVKVKLFFNNESVISVNNFLQQKTHSSYEVMIDNLKKNLN